MNYVRALLVQFAEGGSYTDVAYVYDEDQTVHIKKKHICTFSHINLGKQNMFCCWIYSVINCGVQVWLPPHFCRATNFNFEFGYIQVLSFFSLIQNLVVAAIKKKKNPQKNMINFRLICLIKTIRTNK